MIFKKRIKKQIVCFRLPPEVVESLDKIAKANKVDRTSVIEAALDSFIKDYVAQFGGGKK